jgi:hypothetical protein
VLFGQRLPYSFRRARVAFRYHQETHEKDIAAVCVPLSETAELLPIPLAKYLAFLDQAIEGTGDSLTFYFLEKKDATL